MQNTVIIVAGGSGSRFGGDVPKQFLNLKGKPVLMRTLEVFYLFDNAMELIVVLPENQQDYWQQLCKTHQFYINHKIVFGGKERFHSVKNGLQVMQPVGTVAIHDAVRPLVSLDTLGRCFETAAKLGNAIPVIEPVDSLREMQGDDSKQVARTNYRLVQTPQCFDKAVILKAFEQGYQPEFTDDASVLEKAGHKINLVDGNRENLKVTTPIDLALAEVLLV